MDPFHRCAVFAISRDASFVALAGGTLMVAFSFHLPLALTIGASVALLYALVLLMRVARLTEARLMRSEPWRALDRDQRPAGAAGRRLARDDFEHVLLSAARAATANAVVLYAASLVISVGFDTPPVHEIVTASLH